MKRKLVLGVSVFAVLSVLALFNMYFRPNVLTAEQRSQQDMAREKLAQAQPTVEKSAAADKAAPPATPAPAAQPKGDSKVEWPESAPDTFKVTFECTNGTFVVECTKSWAPLGVERFYQLVKEGFFNDTGFFRVVPGFVVQFGLAADPAVTAKWKSKPLKDDPVTQSNKDGYLTFATSGPNSRTTQLFINTGNNARLDGMGFSAFGKVIEGLDVVKKINPKYGEQPNQGMITMDGSAYLKKNFPEMDFIKKATLTK